MTGGNTLGASATYLWGMKRRKATGANNAVPTRTKNKIALNPVKTLSKAIAAAYAARTLNVKSPRSHGRILPVSYRMYYTSQPRLGTLMDCSGRKSLWFATTFKVISALAR